MSSVLCGACSVHSIFFSSYSAYTPVNALSFVACLLSSSSDSFELFSFHFFSLCGGDAFLFYFCIVLAVLAHVNQKSRKPSVPIISVIAVFEYLSSLIFRTRIICDSNSTLMGLPRERTLTRACHTLTSTKTEREKKNGQPSLCGYKVRIRHGYAILISCD